MTTSFSSRQFMQITACPSNSGSRYEVAFKVSTFPAGEEYVKILTAPMYGSGKLIVSASIRSSTNLIRFLLAIRALRSYYDGWDITVDIPYLPYARQDRICAEGEPFGLHWMAETLLGAGVLEIGTWDCHSVVAETLLWPRVTNATQAQVIQQFARENQDFATVMTNSVLVAPDLGAAKKVEVVADVFSCKGWIQLIKHRRDIGVSHEMLTRDNVAVDHETDVVLLDDILDGGATIVSAVHALRERLPSSSQIDVYVTHCVSMFGIQKVLDAGVNRIYTAHSMAEGESPVFFTSYRNS